MSPRHTFCIRQPWQAVKKMLTSLAKIFSLFLTTRAARSFQPQWFPSTLPLPPPRVDPWFFIHSHTLLLFLSFTQQGAFQVSIPLSLSHTYVLPGREQTRARYGSSEIQTQPQSGLCLEGFLACLQEWIYELQHILIS